MKYIYACDDNYAGLTAISAVSLLKHNPQSNIILLGDNLKSDSVEIVRSRVLNAGGTFQHIDTSGFLEELKRQNIPHYTSFSIFSRLFAADILPDVHERMLYLDSDTLIVDSLSELNTLPLHGKPLALGLDAVHAAYKKHISVPRDKPYFNTGVFLIDPDEWRRRNCSARLMEEFRHPTGAITLPEQDAIARIMNEEVEPLSPRWNYLSQFVLCRVPAHPAIYHFSGHTLGRPWYTSSKHPMREAFRQAAKDAGLAELAEQIRPMIREYVVEYALYRLLPTLLFRPIFCALHRLHIYKSYRV